MNVVKNDEPFEKTNPILNGMFIIMFFGGLLWCVVCGYSLIFTKLSEYQSIALNYGFSFGVLLIIPKGSLFVSNWWWERKSVVGDDKR